MNHASIPQDIDTEIRAALGRYAAAFHAANAAPRVTPELLCERDAAHDALLSLARPGDGAHDSSPRELPTVTPADIGAVLTTLGTRLDAELFSLRATELDTLWHFRWDLKRSLEWNVYEFSDQMEGFKRSCRRWEEHHHGPACVVERVRDRYLWPKIRAFVEVFTQQAQETTSDTARARGYYAAVAVLLREAGVVTTEVQSLFAQGGGVEHCDPDDAQLFRVHGLLPQIVAPRDAESRP